MNLRITNMEIGQGSVNLKKGTPPPFPPPSPRTIDEEKTTNDRNKIDEE